ncbi:MAG: hypothetical protein NC182_06620 [Prevotella sp.]|nr:hypothetical protein [Staphylococcus sp.]MCM1350859.1 hypothetical protein [Prevotella sp.]
MKKVLINIMIFLSLTMMLVSCKKNTLAPSSNKNNTEQNNTQQSDNNNSSNNNHSSAQTELPFNGQGMQFNIYLNAYGSMYDSSLLTTAEMESIYNPFSDNYIAKDKREKQNYIREIEKKYNVTICYITNQYSYRPIEEVIAYDNLNGMHAVITDSLFSTISLKENYSSSGAYQKNNVLEKLYYSLYNTSTDMGIMKDLDIIPTNMRKDLSTYYQNTYLYIPQPIYTYHFLYYDKESFLQMGIDDPQELYQQGKWDNETLKKLCLELQQKDSSKPVISVEGMEDFSNMTYGMASAKRFTFVENQKVVGNNLEAIQIYDEMKDLYENKIFAFGAQQSHFNLRLNRFDNAQELNLPTKKLSLVPYPNFNFESSKIAVTSAPGYAVFNFETMENGFNPEIAFRIIYDLESGYREKSTISEEEIMKDNLSYYLDEESIELFLQCQEKQIYEGMGMLSRISLFDYGDFSVSNKYNVGYINFLFNYMKSGSQLQTNDDKKAFVEYETARLGKQSEVYSPFEAMQIVYDYIYTISE